MILRININPCDVDAISMMREINAMKARELQNTPGADRNIEDEVILEMTLAMDRILAQLYHGCMYKLYKSGIVTRQQRQKEMDCTYMANKQTNTGIVPDGYNPVEGRDPYKPWSKAKSRKVYVGTEKSEQ